MPEILITVGSVEASDSWGFVGTVNVGAVEAFRTLRSFHTPRDATAAAQELVVDMFGEVLAGREWLRMRQERGSSPTRDDFRFTPLSHAPHHPDGGGPAAPPG